MKQTAGFISTYAGDTSGVCSALYELGGMTVMHDPSGCNSTYTTHDEPRWYNSHSLVFLSALTETDAILGNEERLIADTVKTAQALNPRFIALASSPIPNITGADLFSAAAEIERRTKIPCFYAESNGMHSYITGAAEALFRAAERFAKREIPRTKKPTLNILGATPLDFSTGEMLADLEKTAENFGFQIGCRYAYGCDFSDLEALGSATGNLVVSSAGLRTAEFLKREFSTPYLIGIPFGNSFTETLFSQLKNSSQAGFCFETAESPDTLVIGEEVFAQSLAHALNTETSCRARAVAAVYDEAFPAGAGVLRATDEAELIPLFDGIKRVIADPLYRPILPEGVTLIPLPHEAFSGRIFRNKIPALTGEFYQFIDDHQLGKDVIK